MPTIKVERVLHNIDAEQVWNVASDITSYPTLMPHIVEVRRDPQGDQSVTNWIALFNGNEMCWTERDHIDASAMHLSFSQIEGDLAEWGGELQVIGLDKGGVAIRYSVTFDFGIPALAHSLNPRAERAIKRNCEAMLDGIEGKVLLTVEPS